MILFELTGAEDHPAYQELEISNGNRQYDFLRSIVSASLQLDRQFLSTQVIKALNYHAITCLHAYRMKRWGRTQGEADLEGLTAVDIRDLVKGPNRKFGGR